MRVAIVLMLGLVLLTTGTAFAQMTPADEAGMRAFSACLDENGGDEEACLGKLGRYAWYPRDDAVCEAIAARVDEALSSSAQAEWKDLFFNERCARLELAYERKAALAGDSYDPELPYVHCVKRTQNPFPCWEENGRHSWHPRNGEETCEIRRLMSSTNRDLQWSAAWYEVFQNERCFRLGMPYFDPKLEQR